MADSGSKTTKRQQYIMDAVRDAGSARITALAEEFGVSPETVRRDIASLVKAGQLEKRHGFVTTAKPTEEAQFERRMREQLREKRMIARHAARMIADGDSLMMDTGTTTSILARELLRKSNLTVVTNSSDVARTVSANGSNKVYLAGGDFQGDSGAVFGRSALEFARHFRVRHAIISIAATTAEGGFMDYQVGEAEFARTVLSCGERRTVITDHTKFSRTALVKVCGFDEIDLLITDAPPPPGVVRNLKQAGARYEIAHPGAALE